jgi:hypothetical protein
VPKISFAFEPRATTHLLIPGFTFDKGGFAFVIGRLSIVGAWGSAAATF